MVEAHHVGHIIKLIGLVLCVHRYWPSGITYSDPEERRPARKPRRRSRTTRSDDRSRSRSRSMDHRRKRGTEYASSLYGGSGGGMRDVVYHDQQQQHEFGLPPKYEASKGSWYY